MLFAVVPEIIEKPSPNFDDSSLCRLEFLVLHYTGMKTGAEALDRLTAEGSGVSSHYTVDEDGAVYSHVDEGKVAWHAGVSYWRRLKGINRYSVGIEIVNPGHEFGYRKFPEKQMDIVVSLCKMLMEKYSILPENVIAHSDIAPARKKDPGELFPWKWLAREHGIGIWPYESVEDTVKGYNLDVGKALADFGYNPENRERDNLIAFQRHFVPEVFTGGGREDSAPGYACSLTRGRLYALLAGHY